MSDERFRKPRPRNCPHNSTPEAEEQHIVLVKGKNDGQKAQNELGNHHGTHRQSPPPVHYSAVEFISAPKLTLLWKEGG